MSSEQKFKICGKKRHTLKKGMHSRCGDNQNKKRTQGGLTCLIPCKGGGFFGIASAVRQIPQQRNLDGLCNNAVTDFRQYLHKRRPRANRVSATWPLPLDVCGAGLSRSLIDNHPSPGTCRSPGRCGCRRTGKTGLIRFCFRYYYSR